MIRIWSALIVGILAFPVFAQEKLSDQKIHELNMKYQDAQGTYQIQMIETRMLPEISFDLIEKIEKARLETDTSYFYYAPNIRIMVLPEKSIKARDFVPVERIIHIDEPED